MHETVKFISNLTNKYNTVTQNFVWHCFIQVDQIFYYCFFSSEFPMSEAVVRRCYVKKMFLNILQYSQETSVLESVFHKVIEKNLLKS